MHIAYVDESGDLGAVGSPSRLFILSAIVISHESWLKARLGLDAMRVNLDELYGLRESAEIHATQFLGGAKLHHGLTIRRRYQCAHYILNFLKNAGYLYPVRVAVRKGGQGGRPLFDQAWLGLLEEMDIELRHTPESTCGSKGLVVILDHHGALPYRPGEGLPVINPLLELPFGRRSEDSALLQCSDLLGFLTKQAIDPNRHFSGSQGRGLVLTAERLYRAPCRVINP
jgi:hypothetical protein